MAAMTVSMPVTPWLLNRFGYRRTYIGAILLLLAGSIAGGMANEYALVLAMRVAEGLAAGILQPIPAIIILRGFQPDEQGKAMGLFGAGVVLAPALGPSIGGVLVEWFGWRSIFFVASPFCLLALPLAARLLPHSAPGGGEVNADGTRLDVAGLVLVAVAILLGLNGLSMLEGAQRMPGVALMGCSVVVLAVFVAHQKRTAQPLIRLELFTHPAFARGAIVAFVYGCGAVRLDLPAAGVHADGARAAAVAGGRGAAAGGHRARGRDPARRAGGHAGQPLRSTSSSASRCCRCRSSR